MTLRLVSEPTVEGTTIGSLEIDGAWVCWTLEDAVREVDGHPIGEWKVPKETAIPSGRYRVILSQSRRFQKELPEVLNVPGFAGIRIHAGNTIADTEGCILVGRQRTDTAISQSRLALVELIGRLKTATGEIWLTVERA